MVPSLPEPVLQPPPVVAQKQKTILVVCFPQGGYGDFFGALKIADMCKKNFDSQVYFALPEKWAIEQSKIVKNEVKPFPLLTYEGIEKVSELTDCNPDMVIGYVCDGGSADPICEAVCETMKTRPGYLPLTESGGYPPKNGFALGFDKKEIGLFISPDLFNEPKGLNQLAKLSPSLCKEILGKPYSEESAQAFAKKCKLYFGYSFNAATRQWFVDTIVQYNALCKDDRKLVFVLVGPNGKLIKSSKDQCTILPFSDLPHSDMIALLLASERESLGTGELSATDLFSADKIPLIELMDHKRYMTQAILDLAQKQDVDLKNSLSNLFVNPLRNLNEIIAARTLFEIRTKETVLKALNAFNRTIRGLDCSKTIIAEVRKRMPV